MNPKTDFYFNKEGRWHEAVNQLRKIVLSCGFTEELKWGCPCYQYEGRNVVLIHDFKAYCAVLFFKGALLHNKEKLLIQQTENVQAARQMRFTSAKEVVDKTTLLKACLYEAIEVEKAGLTVKMKKPSEFAVAEEFQLQLDKKASLKKAFYALTPGRQRAYLLYFSSAKQSATRSARVEKSISAIMAGKGLNE